MSQFQPPSKASARPSPGTRSAAPVAEAVSWTHPSQRAPLLLLGFLVALLVVAYWDMFALTRAAWKEGLYSHGWIVPILAAGLLLMRWEPFREVPAYERWFGLVLLAFGLSCRLFAAKYAVQPIDRWSFLPSIFGAFMLVGGIHAIRWAWPALAFLFFMFPWPTIFEIRILVWLQKVASICSTFVLQTLGVSAFRSGNLISIPGMAQPLTIADACSGLRMATIFGALAVAMVFVIERPWWDKFVILLSAIPIALIVNIVRITITGLLYMLVGQDNTAVQQICHEYAGLVIMMPLALALLWLELQILERLTIPIEAVQLRPMGGARGVATVPLR